jgi:FixJ family two-component response regulator
MASLAPIVFVLDDQPAVRHSLRWLITSAGLHAETYATAQEFLAHYDPAQPGCLVADVRMPGMSGPELQEELAARGIRIPIIFVTAYGDTSTAVRVLKMGAEDFLQKPFSNQVILDRIRRAIATDAETRRRHTDEQSLAALIGRLTARERQVVSLVAAGKTNKAIAQDLAVSEKTVEFHRANAMNKLNAQSLAELVQILVQATSLGILGIW